MSEKIKIEPETAQETAFTRTHFELFGAPLRKYSASRKVAAQAMGMQWPFIGDAALAQMQATNMYPGALRDAAIVCWLCTLADASDLSAADVKSRAWNPSRALDKPGEARGAALEWAEQNGVTDTSGAKFAEAFQVFFAIVTGVDASTFRIEVEKTGGESAGDPGNV